MLTWDTKSGKLRQLDNEKIVITGPESSGKTTLFKKLISSYNILGVDEYAREYIGDLNRNYNYFDILEIAKKQFENEQILSITNPQFLISDTDLLTLEIWCEFKYGKCHSFILDTLRNHLPNIYILCYPDIPWKFDPQRENPNDRIDLYNLYEKKIKSLGVKYHVVNGDLQTRYKSLKTIINNISNS